MTKLDQFTLDLLTNDDVLDVDQDPLGVAATVVKKDEGYEVWSRPLWDGTVAVALFNQGEAPRELGVDFTALGLSGAQPVRHLWLRTDLGDFSGSFKAMVPPHGAVMVKIGKAKD